MDKKTKMTNYLEKIIWVICVQVDVVTEELDTTNIVTKLMFHACCSHLVIRLTSHPSILYSSPPPPSPVYACMCGGGRGCGFTLDLYTSLVAHVLWCSRTTISYQPSVRYGRHTDSFLLCNCVISDWHHIVLHQQQQQPFAAGRGQRCVNN